MLQLKRYQEHTIQQIETYARLARQMQDVGIAFYKLTKEPYKPAPDSLAPVPYVCIQIPTGGGKTLVACHSVGIFTHYLHRDTGLVVWFVPWESILTQTLAALRDRGHPYRQVLEAAFPQGVRVVTVKEALFGALKPDDLADNLCIIVTTLDAFRVENKEGRKVYEVNGYLMSHFENLPPEFEVHLERDDNGLVIQSLANVIRLYNILDISLDEEERADLRRGEGEKG
jgi:type III restriction enzyme